MKQSVLCIIVFCLSILPTLGQTHSSANNMFQEGDYVGAQQAYGALLRSYPTNALYLYRYARCAQELGDYETALQYFEKAGDRYMLKYFYVGEIYMQLWRAEEAITAYTTYLNSLREPNEREDYIKAQINHANKLNRYLRRVERLQIIDSVQVSLDSMLTPCALSAEAGKLILDTANSVVYTNQRGDRRLQAVTSDSNTVLVSSHRLLEHWTKADTLPEDINFTPHQSSPYLLNDGVTLYFAAKDSNGLGGLDIYISRYNMATETYTTPENIGMPYNSPANEYMLLLDEMRGIGYLATDRFAPSGRVHIYSFVIPQRKQYYEMGDSLAAYARLELFENGTKPTQAHKPHSNTKENDDETKEFYFIINDSIVYDSLNDFRNPIAKEKYNEWVKLDQQYHSEQNQLVVLRQRYASADESTQKELTPTILRIENNQSQLYKRCQSLLHDIRKLELDTTQQ